MQEYQIQIPIYSRTVVIRIYPNIISYNNGVVENFGEEYKSTLGLTVHRPEKHVIYINYLKKALSYNLIAHESFHAVEFIMEYKAIHLDSYSASEAWAYLIGWLVAEQIKIFQEQKLKIDYQS